MQAIADKTALERVVVQEVDDAHGMSMLDANARRYLGITGQAFLTRWKQGAYPDPDSDPKVILVASLLPFVKYK